MKTTFLYAISTPGNPRYVGKSNNPKKRFVTHLRHARQGSPAHMYRWIRQLWKQETQPHLEILCQVPKTEWEFWERYLIDGFRKEGHDLINQTPGGECGPVMLGPQHPRFGKSHSAEARKKISEAGRGRKSTPESSAARSAAFRGVRNPNFGKSASLETREKQRQAKLGKKRGPQSPEHLAKRIASLLARNKLNK